VNLCYVENYYDWIRWTLHYTNDRYILPDFLSWSRSRNKNSHNKETYLRQLTLEILNTVAAEELSLL
jgi:hypothetical protein